MGKRKRKATNVVKVDLGDITIKKNTALPVLVQHLSKDGRRIEQTVHRIPIPRSNPSPLTFDPYPVVAEDEDDTFFDIEPPGGEDGGDGGDRVCSRFYPLLDISDGPIHSWIRYGYGVRIAIFFSRNLSCGKGVWASPMESVTFVRIPVRSPSLNTQGWSNEYFRFVPLSGLYGRVPVLRRVHRQETRVHSISQNPGASTRVGYGVFIYQRVCRSGPEPFSRRPASEQLV